MFIPILSLCVLPQDPSTGLSLPGLSGEAARLIQGSYSLLDFSDIDSVSNFMSSDQPDLAGWYIFFLLLEVKL
jgi:hypothetical protein